MLYTIALVDEPEKTVSIGMDGNEMVLKLSGFGEAAKYKVSSGTVETCRTIVSHSSENESIEVSLPIPQPDTPCQMMPGFVTIKSSRLNVSVSETEVKTVSGEASDLRKRVQKLFGSNN